MSISLGAVLGSGRLFYPLIALFMVFTFVNVLLPFNKGIEFGGGYLVSYHGSLSDSDSVNQYLLSENTDSEGVTLLKLSTELPAESLDALKQQLGDTLLYVETISPSYGEEMITESIHALGFAMLAMTLYLSIKYNAFMAVFTQLALIMDVTISLGVATLFGVELNVLLIGALITIIGYSVNDSVVTIDCISDKLRAKEENPINSAIESVLPRSLITSQSTLLVLVVLMAVSYNSEGLFGFALVLSFGVISGTLSSLVLIPRLMELVPSSLNLVAKPSLDGDI